MNGLSSFRYLVISVLGILSLMATVASSAPYSLRQSGQAVSDVSLSMVADRKVVKAGQQVIYTVTMTNLGPNDATFVDVVFIVPVGLQVVSIRCDHGISPDGPFCEYASLLTGTSVVSILLATPETGTPLHSRMLTASASILFENADTFDPNNSNNAAAVNTKVIGRLP